MKISISHPSANNGAALAVAAPRGIAVLIVASAAYESKPYDCCPPRPAGWQENLKRIHDRIESLHWARR